MHPTQMLIENGNSRKTHVEKGYFDTSVNYIC